MIGRLIIFLRPLVELIGGLIYWLVWVLVFVALVAQRAGGP